MGREAEAREPGEVTATGRGRLAGRPVRPAGGSSPRHGRRPEPRPGGAAASRAMAPVDLPRAPDGSCSRVRQPAGEVASPTQHAYGLSTDGRGTATRPAQAAARRGDRRTERRPRRRPRARPIRPPRACWPGCCRWPCSRTRPGGRGVLSTHRGKRTTRVEAGPADPRARTRRREAPRPIRRPGRRRRGAHRARPVRGVERRRRRHQPQPLPVARSSPLR